MGSKGLSAVATVPAGSDAATQRVAHVERRQLPGATVKQLSICLVNPKFEPSYWGFEYALPLYPGDKRCTMITGALPAVAGLVPAPHEVVLLDENVEEIDFEGLRRFDIVGVTGMTVQKKRMREILVRLRELGIFIAVGGAYASVDEKFFDGLCDVLFVGEAETTWPEFLDDFAAGRPTKRVYEQAERTDMTKVPKPRYDLLKVGRYASGALQFSRGCPFQCEFCDIIVTFGRRPRTKTAGADHRGAGRHAEGRVLLRLPRRRQLHRQQEGGEGAAAADHPLAGAATAIRSGSRPRRASTSPTTRSCSSSCTRANFRHVFIGIETPARRLAQGDASKFQNIQGDSLEAKVERIQNAGIDVHAGFIVGFDNDDQAIFEDQYRFIQDNGILLAMVGMLVAIQKTPLYERLEAEGRLVEDDPNCNIVPKQMTREELQRGYWELVRRLYTPEAFFDRYFRVYRFPEYHRRRAEISGKAGEGKLVPTLGYGLALLWTLSRTLIKERALWSVGKVYLRYFFRVNLKYRRDVVGFAQFMNRCVTHWHFYKFTRLAIEGKLRLFGTT